MLEWFNEIKQQQPQQQGEWTAEEGTRIGDKFYDDDVSANGAVWHTFGFSCTFQCVCVCTYFSLSLSVYVGIFSALTI